MDARALGRLLLQSAFTWQRNNAALLAAGLCYYAIFSLVPLAMLAVAMAGFFLGDHAASGALAAQLDGFIGPRAAQAIQSVIDHAGRSARGVAALSLVLLLFGASGIFMHLQSALNTIWGVGPTETVSGFLHQVKAHARKRLVSFVMVVICGLFLMVSFFLEAALAAIKSYLVSLDSSLGNVTLWQSMNGAVSFLLVMVMTALIYQFLPDAQVSWRDVWPGAAMSSFLIACGRQIVGLYFRFRNVGSVFGAAGSLVLVLVAIYVSAQIFLFGAAFTRAYAGAFGSHVRRLKMDDAGGG